MNLSPEEKQRIYAEEKARQEAREKAKLEADRKNLRTGCIGCLSIIGIIVLIMAFTGAFKSGGDGNKPSYVDLNAAVRFTGTQFVITNGDAFDWLNVKLEVNPGLLAGGYQFKASRLQAGSTYTVGAMQFAKADGTRFNPFTTKPKSFSILCDTPSGARGSYYGNWE